MKATCPKNPEHNLFSTTVHVVQEWVVDSQGNFVKIVDGREALEVIADPDPMNIWTCRDCGAEAIVKE